MAKWMVLLEGVATDLEEFPEHFPGGAMYAVREDDAFYVCGDALEQFGSASEVRDAAQAFVDEASAVISLLWPELRKPQVGSVFRDRDGKGRDVWVFVQSGEIRAKAGRFTLRVGGESVPPVPVALRMLDTARSSEHLRRALLLWSDKPRSWHRLFVVIEELEQFLAGSIADAGYCSTEELERFRHTANSADAAGLDARHAWNPNRLPPRNPMSLSNAEEFVRGVLDAVLRRAADL